MQASPTKNQNKVASLGVLWHLTSLDAPLLAVLWTALFSFSADVRSTPLELCALALAVWILYVSDRLLDARKNTSWEMRHRFHWEHRRILLCLLSVAAPLLAILVPCLPSTLRNDWLLLGVPLVSYLLLVHKTRINLPKEGAVALFFAAACATPSVAVSGTAMLPSTVALAMLCWINCIGIARWEEPSRMHPTTRWATEHFALLCNLSFAMSALLLCTGRIAIALAISAATYVLWRSDSLRGKTSRLHLRVLADAALLTPLLWFALPHVAQMELRSSLRDSIHTVYAAARR